MTRTWVVPVSAIVIGMVLTGPSSAQEPAGDVAVHDGGAKVSRATWECTPGHEVRKHRITLDSGAVRYTFMVSGCLDPSHGDQHPCNEGTFGMPDPSLANWYWGGFMKVLVNGTNATLYQAEEPRVLETGARGLIQIVWAHPAADVGLRLMMLPAGNHVLAELVWRPRADAAVETVALRLTCYPSFFTTARQRTGERHCRTPRVDMAEGQPLKLVPGEDAWLYYYDRVFDVANGEGDGPCAVLLDPSAVTAGSVSIGGYAVTTAVDLDPEAGRTRLALYDFTGLSNADAGEYMEQHAADDQARLAEMDFRPGPVRGLDVAEFTAEVTGLLAAAAEDGEALKPQVDELLARMAELKPAADEGDWTAEADLAELLLRSPDILWKLKAFAVLNRQ